MPLAHLAAAAALICLDPGHGTIPAIGRQIEAIGPGSSEQKIKDGGGTAGEAPVALAIALRTRALLKRDGYRVAMTRTGPTYAGGNIERARFCNARHAALMIRIHADGATDSSLNGVKTLVPALHRGWTDDIYASSVRAARKVQLEIEPLPPVLTPRAAHAATRSSPGSLTSGVPASVTRARSVPASRWASSSSRRRGAEWAW